MSYALQKFCHYRISTNLNVRASDMNIKLMFIWCSYGFHMVFIWFLLFYLVFAFSCGVHMMFMWFLLEFHRVLRCDSHFHMVFNGFHVAFICLPYDIHMTFIWSLWSLRISVKKLVFDFWFLQFCFFHLFDVL